MHVTTHNRYEYMYMYTHEVQVQIFSQYIIFTCLFNTIVCFRSEEDK